MISLIVATSQVLHAAPVSTFSKSLDSWEQSYIGCAGGHHQSLARVKVTPLLERLLFGHALVKDLKYWMNLLNY